MIGSIATVVGFVIATIVSLEALLVSPGRQHLFAWHPFLMSMGALGLSTAGIQAVRSRWGTKGIQSKTRRVQVRVVDVTGMPRFYYTRLTRELKAEVFPYRRVFLSDPKYPQTELLRT